MTGNEFKTARKTVLKLSQTELGMMLETSKRTLQNVEACGDQEIKGIYAAAIKLLIRHDAIVTRAVNEKVKATIERHHPHGIVSEPLNDALNED